MRHLRHLWSIIAYSWRAIGPRRIATRLLAYSTDAAARDVEALLHPTTNLEKHRTSGPLVIDLAGLEPLSCPEVRVLLAMLASSLAAATGNGPRIFLVSDSMSQAGTDIAQFTLHGDTIYRKDGALRLADGTLAASNDDDGSASEKPAFITSDQLQRIIALTDEVKADKERFCKYLKIGSLAEILASDFDHAMKLLEAKRSK